MDRFFSILGKIMLGTIALIFVIGAGYYIGTHKNEMKLSPTPFPTSAQPTKIPPTKTILPIEEPTPTIQAASPSGIVTEE